MLKNHAQDLIVRVAELQRCVDTQLQKYPDREREWGPDTQGRDFWVDKPKNWNAQNLLKLPSSKRLTLPCQKKLASPPLQTAIGPYLRSYKMILVFLKTTWLPLIASRLKTGWSPAQVRKYSPCYGRTYTTKVLQDLAICAGRD